MKLPVWFLGMLLAGQAAPAQDPSLAERAYAVLQTRCYRCHGGSGKAAGLDVLSPQSLTERRGQGDSTSRLVNPGEPDSSQLWDAVQSKYMPDEGSAEARAITEEERQILRQWIGAGIPFPELRKTEFLSEKRTLERIRDFLKTASAEDRRFLRFFTLAHIQNNPKISEQQLRMYRAALSMAVNSLSLEPRLEVPRPVPGTHDCVLAIDIRKVGWERENRWGQILAAYPYGLKYHYVKDRDFQQIAQEIEQLSGTAVPYLRADWFAVHATQPPLYYSLLGIPGTLDELEAQLGIDRAFNFLEGRMARAGFSKSNVSQQNRLVERHESPAAPYYWISYDFKPRRAKGDLMRFPLGPEFPGHPFPNQAFNHDGGEVIWSLPNGLQGYMLVRNDGRRIDRGPVDVVFDKSPVIGTPEIVNGISCMICHRQGMILGFRDEVREADAVAGEMQRKVEQIYPTPDVLERLAQQDKALFMGSLARTLGPFLQVDEDREKPLESFPQPVSFVADQYMQDLTAEQVAWELGVEKFDSLKGMIEANRGLLKFGLGNLTQEPPGTMKREKWEAIDGTSLMQDVSLELRMGTPYRQFGFVPN